ncbi:MAG: UDP-N-acetylmuramate dehydrogenase [Bacteroidales bacterium]|jgi:UDP-N-acetylmuramate dehydrogenase
MENISLRKYNTFGLDYKADKLVAIRSEEEASQMVRNGDFARGENLIVSGGSNLLFISDFHGTIIHPEIDFIFSEDRDKASVTVSAGAGVTWDRLVEWCVDHDLGGIENLSYIPGNTGATPVQNIGAYGVEIKDCLQKITAVSLDSGEIREFTTGDCKFGYRDSIFKRELRNKYLITRVSLNLSRDPLFKLNYGFLEAETAAIGEISLKNIRKAVITIRSRKLPDPTVIGNAGSFFKNPVVTVQKADEIQSSHPLVPVYDEPSGGKKLAAGWLIEQCGWKGKRIGDAGVHEKQALVLVNYGKAKGIDIFNLSEMIRRSVYEKFGIELQREVEVIGSI